MFYGGFIAFSKSNRTLLFVYYSMVIPRSQDPKCCPATPAPRTYRKSPLSYTRVKGGIFMLLTILNKLILCILHADTPYLFPKPLTAAEERACFEQMENGDKSAKNRLTTHNLRLVAHIAGKYRSSGEELEELVSIGTFGLMKAVETFDYRKGARFSTYAARCVEKPPHTVRLFWNRRR